jgi:hypothetical protein
VAGAGRESDGIDSSGEKTGVRAISLARKGSKKSMEELATVVWLRISS